MGPPGWLARGGRTATPAAGFPRFIQLRFSNSIGLAGRHRIDDCSRIHHSRSTAGAGAAPAGRQFDLRGRNAGGGGHRNRVDGFGLKLNRQWGDLHRHRYKVLVALAPGTAIGTA